MYYFWRENSKIEKYQSQQTADIGKNCKQTAEIRKMNVNKQLIFVKKM